MKKIRNKWNDRYEMVHVPNQVIDVLELNQHLLPAGGKSLDLACGLGGNALRMAELGFESHAWDISDAAIVKINEFAQERQLRIFTQQSDISQPEQQQKMLKESFDVIIVSRFLLRDIIPDLISALKPGGLIFYQTFIEEECLQQGLFAELTMQAEKKPLVKAQPESGPKNSHFRLQTNELLNLFSGLKLRYYREDGQLGNMKKGLRNEAMLVAQKNKLFNDVSNGD